MKKFTLLAVMTLALVGASFAQTVDKTKTDKAGKAGIHRAHGRHGVLKGITKTRLGEQLALTDAQKEKIKVLNNQFKAQLKGLKDSKGDRDAKKGQAKGIIKQHREAILAVLTPEQKAKLATLKKDRKDRTQKRRIGRSI